MRAIYNYFNTSLIFDDYRKYKAINEQMEKLVEGIQKIVFPYLSLHCNSPSSITSVSDAPFIMNVSWKTQYANRTTIHKATILEPRTYDVNRILELQQRLKPLDQQRMNNRYYLLIERIKSAAICIFSGGILSFLSISLSAMYHPLNLVLGGIVFIASSKLFDKTLSSDDRFSAFYSYTPSC